MLQSNMNSRLLLLTSAVCFGALFAAAPAPENKPASTSPPATTAPKPGTPAPQYPKKVHKTLWAKKDLRGKRAPQLIVDKWLGAKPDLKNKVILIDFWATWCPPCRASIPELQKFHEQFKDDLVIIGITNEKPDVVQSFVNSHGMTYSIGIDPKARMEKGITKSIPHILIISSDNFVRWQGNPLDQAEPLTPQIIQQIIDADKAARAAQPPARKESKKPEAKTSEKEKPDAVPDSDADTDGTDESPSNTPDAKDSPTPSQPPN